MTTTTLGMVSIPSVARASLLYSSSFLTPHSEKVLYRFIISNTAHCSAPAAFLGSVTTGISRWGIPL